MQQAKLFLDDAGEFYPFGTAFDKDNNIKPIGVFLENDYPDSLEVLAFLKEAIEQNVSNGNYIAAAICVDVYVTNNGEKQNAVQITFYSKQESHSEFYLYHKTQDGFSF